MITAYNLKSEEKYLETNNSDYKKKCVVVMEKYIKSGNYLTLPCT